MNEDVCYITYLNACDQNPDHIYLFLQNKPVLSIQRKQQHVHQLTWKIWEGIKMHGLMLDC